MDTQKDFEDLNKKLQGILDKQTTFSVLLDHIIVRYARGSVLYGTFEAGLSDYDWLIVVDDCFIPFLEKFPKGIYQDVQYNNDYEFIAESNFIERLKNNEIDMLECVFSKPDACDGKYKKIVDENLDLWKLRQSVSGVCSNSWVKCKKKLTVEKDYNLRVAQKSLWHSLRLYMFGTQIANNGTVVNWKEANDIWFDITHPQNDDTSWEYYKKLYQPMFNMLRSEFVKLCEKPKEI